MALTGLQFIFASSDDFYRQPMRTGYCVRMSNATAMKTLEEVKAAVEAGLTVQWGNSSYRVTKTKGGELMIICTNGHCAVLTNDYKAEDFYTKEA
jgi:hypothetical protein